MLLFSKFTKQVETIFKMLPKRLEWLSFYTNNLPLIMEICEDVRKISIKNQLNKSQLKAFQHIINTIESKYDPKNDVQPKNENSASIVPLRDMSAREIRQKKVIFQSLCCGTWRWIK